MPLKEKKKQTPVFFSLIVYKLAKCFELFWSYAIRPVRDVLMGCKLLHGLEMAPHMMRTADENPYATGSYAAIVASVNLNASLSRNIWSRKSAR